MLINKKIKKIAGFLSIIIFAFLIFLYIKELNVKYEFFVDLSWSMLGSSIMAWIVAQITYNTECTNIRRKIIINILSIQNEIKCLDENFSTIDTMSSIIFFECAERIKKYISEFYAIFDAFKYEIGNDCYESVKLDGYCEIYIKYSDIRHHIYHIGNLLSQSDASSQRVDICKALDELWQEERIVVQHIKKICKKEYGKEFAERETINLM